MICCVFRSFCLSALVLSFVSGCQTAGKTARLDQPRHESVQLTAGNERSGTGVTPAIEEQAAESRAGLDGEGTTTEGNAATGEEKRGWAKWTSNPLSQLIPQTARSENDSEEAEIAGRDLF
ncbi:MAG: hypothetical protein CMJ46_09665 [Planctomyces sp.]|nr:hypothetical protein [Planctomyces sp.]